MAFFFIGEVGCLFFLFFIYLHMLLDRAVIWVLYQIFPNASGSLWEHNTLGSSSYNSINPIFIFYSGTWSSISVFAVMVFQLYLLLF
jgi:hypothetical protein